MKKFLSIVLAVAMLLALASCGDTADVSSESTVSEAVSSDVVSETSSEETSSVEEPVS